MKLHPPQTLESIASFLKAEYIGKPKLKITGINEIHRVEKGDIVFVDHPKYYKKTVDSDASVIIIDKKTDCPQGKGLIISNQPFRDFNRLINKFSPFRAAAKSISDTAHIGRGTILQPGVFIGNGVEIGKNCLIHSNVSIYDGCRLGNNVIIHSGTVIGSDAFYYQKKNNGYNKFFSCGSVIIEDGVEIGANCTIDRGVTNNTIIGKGTKFDNLVHIGHDTIIGRNCLFAAQVGIAGMVTIEDDVVLWGQVGVISNVTIGKGAVVFAQSGISKSLKGKISYFGSPAGEAKEKFRELVKIRQITAVGSGRRQQQEVAADGSDSK